MHVTGRHLGRVCGLEFDLALGQASRGARPSDDHRDLCIKDRPPQALVFFGLGALVEKNVDGNRSCPRLIRRLDPLGQQFAVEGRAIMHLVPGHRVLIYTQDHDVLAQGFDRNQRYQADVGDPILDQRRRRENARRRDRRRRQRRRQNAERDHPHGPSVENHRSSTTLEAKDFTPRAGSGATSRTLCYDADNQAKDGGGIMEPVRWGFIGATADVVSRRVLAAMQACEHATVVALASRDESAARALATEYGVPRSHGSYDALIADPEIEAVYIPLPNHLHLPWSQKAVEAGKHVLCEKPLGLNAAEVEKLIDLRERTGMQIQESFMIRSHPQWLRARALVREGRIGTLRAIQGIFGHHCIDPENVRNVLEMGGGGLYDIGCYPITTSRFIFGDEPSRVVALLDRDRPSASIAWPARYSISRPASFVCSQQTALIERMLVLGTAGRIELRMPFDAPHQTPCELLIDDGSVRHDGSATLEAQEVADQYTIQGDLYSKAIRTGAPLAIPLEDSLANMRVIDALFRSAESGAWETV